MLVEIKDNLTGEITIVELDEICLDVEASQGLYQPLWNGSEWVEGATEIPTPTPELPTDEQLLEELSNIVQQLKERGVL
jgi:hypothetical protein